MKFNGLTDREVEESRKKHGSNAIPDSEPTTFWQEFKETFGDPMIKILLAIAALMIVMFFFGYAEIYEPLGTIVAVLIVATVSAKTGVASDTKYRELKDNTEKDKCKVHRNGVITVIDVDDVVVGDKVLLQSGDKIPADGVLIDGALRVDNSALNGEAEECKKTAASENFQLEDDITGDTFVDAHSLFRGAVIFDGEGILDVRKVGLKTMMGKMAEEMQEDEPDSPLKVKLAKLAKQISQFGYVGACGIMIAIILQNVLTGHMPENWHAWMFLIVAAVSTSVTIIVCAVPEGLPSLTSILSSFQSIRMIKDNVLVHKINGLETAGSLSILFSDKTGTITEGKLTVTEMATGDVKQFKKLSEVGDVLKKDIVTGIGINNSATISDNAVIGGNSTDRALMSFLLDAKQTEFADKENVIKFNSFDSAKKYSSVTIGGNGQAVTYIKGAPEKILERCDKYLDENGTEKELKERGYLDTYMNEQAERSMRLLAVAKRNGDSDEGALTLVCVISIRDNVRMEAKDAIREVQRAGIQVVMVTGDRKETAVAIAKEAGLLVDPDDIALTSAEMAEKSDEEMKALLPHLRVVSRALPTDKSRLVKLAQELDEVVGMTGDGVNDSPALKKADVGFAMGSGTEVAKEAGDITILDDNFASIKKAILYGRTMFKSIRKFLIFQLTVNVAAVLTCFIGPLLGENTILTVTQLLLINLAMDTLAAIAFGSEPALEEYMKDRPIPRKESIITKNMMTEILIGALYITGICLSILFVPAVRNLFGDVDVTYLKSALFATFMMAITFNGFNARTEHINPFEHIGRNKNFLLVMGAIFLMQFVFVTFGGEVLSVERLSVHSWMICLILAFMVIPIDVARKLIIRKH